MAAPTWNIDGTVKADANRAPAWNVDGTVQGERVIRERFAGNLFVYGEGVNDLGQPFRVEVYKRGFLGEATRLAMVDDAYAIRGNSIGQGIAYAPIRTTTATLHWDDPDGVLAGGMRRAGSMDLSVRIIESGELAWRGYVTPAFERTLDFTRREVSLNAIDGLGLLKDMPFVSLDDRDADGRPLTYTGRRRMIEWALEVFRHLDLLLPMVTVPGPYSDAVPPTATGAAADPFYAHLLDAGLWQNGVEPVSVEDALKQLCLLTETTLVQSAGRWQFVARRRERSAPYTRHLYNAEGLYLATEQHDPTVYLDQARMDRSRLADPFESELPPLKSVTASFTHGEVPQLIRGGTFGGDRLRGSFSPEGPRGAAVGRGTGSRDTTVGSSGRTRRGTNRAFQGRYRPRDADQAPAQRQVQGWQHDDGTYPPFHMGEAYQEGNAVGLPAYLHDSDYTHLEDVERRAVSWVGRQDYFVEASDEHRILIQTAVRLLPGNLEDKQYLNPVWWEALLHLEDGTTRWLLVNGSWVTTTARNNFGSTVQSDGTILNRKGIPADTWVVLNMLSDPVPQPGGWLELRLWAALDINWDIWTARRSIAGVRYSDVNVQLVIRDQLGVQGHTVTVVDPAAGTLQSRAPLVTVAGKTPLRNMVQSITDAGGLPVGTWRHEKDAATGAGVTLEQALAEGVFYQQRGGPLTHTQAFTHYLGARVHPHHVLQYPDGSRWSLDSFTYSGARCRIEGEWREVRYDTQAAVVEGAEEVDSSPRRVTGGNTGGGGVTALTTEVGAVQQDAAALETRVTATEDTSSQNSGRISNVENVLPLKADLVDGKVPADQLPALAISDFLGAVSSEAAMLGLVGQRGDWAVRTDTSETYILVADDPTVATSWRRVEAPGGVQSVNGQTGIVVIPAATEAQDGLMVAGDKAKLNGLLQAAQLPAGGTAGQVLTKTGSADYATGWADPALRPVYIFNTVSGTPGAGSLLLSRVAPNGGPFMLRAGMPDSVASVRTAPGSDVVMPMLRNGTQIGSVTIAAGQTLGTFALANDVDFFAGDRLDIYAPSPTDGQMGDLTFTLVAHVSTATPPPPGPTGGDVWYSGQSADFQVAATPASHALGFGMGASLSGLVYLLGGADTAGNDANVFSAYDPVAKTYTGLPNLPYPTHWGAAVALRGAVHLVCGADNGRDVFLNQHYAYTPGAGGSTGSWAGRALHPSGRYSLSACAHADRYIYTVGGVTASGTFGDVYRYDADTAAWTTLASLPHAVRDAGLASDGTYVYQAGGYDGTAWTGSVHRYDPATNTWERIATMPTPLRWVALLPYDGVLYMHGEAADGTPHALAYDLAAGTWTTLAAPPYATRRGYRLHHANMLWHFAGRDAAGADTTVAEAYAPPGVSPPA